MGYRLCVEKVGSNEPSYYGTKLYGYTDEEKLKSYQWLIKKGYLDKDKYYVWSYCEDNAILMRVEDFIEFAKLYNEDCNTDYLPYYPEDKDFFINDEDIQKFLQLNPWELVVISWG